MTYDAHFGNGFAKGSWWWAPSWSETHSQSYGLSEGQAQRRETEW